MRMPRPIGARTLTYGKRATTREATPTGSIAATRCSTSFSTTCGASRCSTLGAAPAPDSPRREHFSAWKDDNYFVRRAGYEQWGALKPILSFHRPMRDYVAACQRAGLELRDIYEPDLSEEGRRVLPAYLVRQNQRAPVSYVLKHGQAWQR